MEDVVQPLTLPYKNIAICADGTGNTTVKGRGTNVFKLYEAIDQNGHRANPSLRPQVALYSDGVGSQGVRWIRIVAGATGWGLSRNVKALYGELARVYEAGDEIFMFGFSRGAFTVRTLAGLVATCGILDVTKGLAARDLDKAVGLAYSEYRRRYQTWFSKLLRGKRQPRDEAFRKQHSIQHAEYAPNGLIPIKFLGVWDTVDAVGLPFHFADVINAVFYRFKFPDQHLNKRVAHAYHALAIDEQRRSFAPLLWDEDPDESRIEQVWFSGVHSNVGGGYPRQGMSLVALDWMLEKASQHGLRFLSADRSSYQRRHSVDDRLYNSRLGFGLFYRWQPRDIRKICEAHGTRPQVHASVFERVARATDGYAPGNLPAACDVVFTAHPLPGLQDISALVQKAHGSSPSLLARVPKWVRIGFLSYYLFVVSSAALVIAAFQDGLAASGQSTIEFTAGLLGGTGLLKLGGALWAHPTRASIGIAGLLVAYALSRIAGAKMDGLFARFWHRHQPNLRRLVGL